MNYLRVASGSNKVEAGMDSAIMVSVQHAFDLQLFLKECIKLGINVVHDRLPATRGEYRNIINHNEQLKLFPFTHYDPDTFNRRLQIVKQVFRQNRIHFKTDYKALKECDRSLSSLECFCTHQPKTNNNKRMPLTLVVLK